MRYLLLLLTILVSAITASAAPPKLNVEQLFDGSYNTDKTVSIHISKSHGKYYRGFTVKDNPKLIAKVTELFRKDAEKGDDSQEIIDKGRLSYASMKLQTNAGWIQVGVSFESANSCYLFITGPLEAFK